MTLGGFGEVWQEVPKQSFICGHGERQNEEFGCQFLVDVAQCVIWGLVSIASSKGDFLIAFKKKKLHAMKVTLFGIWVCEF